MKTKYTSNKALVILTICLIFSLLLILSSCNGISSGGDKDKNKDNAQEIADVLAKYLGKTNNEKKEQE